MIQPLSPELAKALGMTQADDVWCRASPREP
jgi:hypothetical protein